jgi:hypothetical protein
MVGLHGAVKPVISRLINVCDITDGHGCGCTQSGEKNRPRIQPKRSRAFIATVILKDGRRYARAVITGGIVSATQGDTVIPFREDKIAELVVTRDTAGMR